MTFPDDLRTLTVEEVAEVLGVRPEAVRIYARAGRLAAYKVGRRLRFRPGAVDEFLESLRLAVSDPAGAARRAAPRRHPS
jgi:excisionase family DNA binding protein